MKWPLGKVIESFEGKDGLIRAVRLKTAKGELTRPVQKLYKLELSDHVVQPLDLPGETTGSLPASPGEATRKLGTNPMTSRSGRTIRSRHILDL